MQRACDACGQSYDAKRPSSRFCSPTCRKRNQRSPKPKGAAVVDLPRPEPAESSLAAVTQRTLEEAGRLDTVIGRQAVALAVAIELPGQTGSSVASLSKELREVMDVAMRGVNVAADPVDELRVMRERKLRSVAGS